MPSAFTLIEIMIVVCIMGIVLTMGVPIVYKAFRREAMAQALNDLREVCKNARADAIMNSRVSEVIFHPREKRFEVSGAAAASAPGAAGAAIAAASGAPDNSHSGRSGQFSEKIMVEMLDVNLMEYKDSEIARVRFYPNGTCDELTVVLHSVDNEWRKVWLEVTTSLINIGPVR
jgi:prepilin-type N-terminal cleavage/methylation domain-containing protein